MGVEDLKKSVTDNGFIVKVKVGDLVALPPGMLVLTWVLLLLLLLVLPLLLLL